MQRKVEMDGKRAKVSNSLRVLQLHLKSYEAVCAKNINVIVHTVHTIRNMWEVLRSRQRATRQTSSDSAISLQKNSREKKNKNGQRQAAGFLGL